MKLSLIEENSSIIMPIVFMPLYDAARHHWNSTIVMLVCNVLKVRKEKTLVESDCVILEHF